MPPPALPKRDTAPPITDPSPSPTPVQLTGPSPISLPIVSRKKQETSKAATAAQQRSRSASVASNSSDTSNGSSSSGSSTTSARSAIDKSYQESSAFALDNLARILLDPDMDRLEFAEQIVNLPPKTSHVSDWSPGLVSIQRSGEHHYPRCQISLTELIKDYSGLKSFPAMPQNYRK